MANSGFETPLKRPYISLLAQNINTRKNPNRYYMEATGTLNTTATRSFGGGIPFVMN